jgi:hypothetical protein
LTQFRGRSRAGRIRQGTLQRIETQLDIPASRFANALLDNIAGFSGHNSARAQEDDITLLVLDFQ